MCRRSSCLDRCISKSLLVCLFQNNINMSLCFTQDTWKTILDMGRYPLPLCALQCDKYADTSWPTGTHKAMYHKQTRCGSSWGSVPTSSVALSRVAVLTSVAQSDDDILRHNHFAEKVWIPVQGNACANTLPRHILDCRNGSPCW